MAAKRNGNAIGAVALIAACFLASAGLRAGGVGFALAQDALGGTPSAEAGCVPQAADELLAAIREREAQLERDAERLTERRQTLNVAEAKLAEQLAAFEEARAGLEETIALTDGAAERDIAQMTAVYERMKPEDAARIFERMELSFASGLLVRMNADSAAQVLTGMDADTAYAITLMIASRNARAPTD
jgi:flagellar motility protein MotE (MotC chaperone)